LEEKKTNGLMAAVRPDSIGRNRIHINNYIVKKRNRKHLAKEDNAKVKQ
jgi:hypothetical protein